MEEPRGGGAYYSSSVPHDVKDQDDNDDNTSNTNINNSNNQQQNNSGSNLKREFKAQPSIARSVRIEGERHAHSNCRK